MIRPYFEIIWADQFLAVFCFADLYFSVQEVINLQLKGFLPKKVQSTKKSTKKDYSLSRLQLSSLEATRPYFARLNYPCTAQQGFIFPVTPGWR